MVVVTDKEKKKLAEKHNKMLAELAKQPDNSTCADCGASGKYNAFKSRSPLHKMAQMPSSNSKH
ncbi:hypothetical protein LPJ66_008168 [Kickxella alabastrina]|uniref:Uncharacterized protein n=1 Tax=Kickxella alabastrina TaxID=61397 RepID=A0ACC1IAL3_9FUNG|nr:hypothetical protein LPJ66_008168 [Kickxella alabastrina]